MPKLSTKIQKGISCMNRLTKLVKEQDLRVANSVASFELSLEWNTRNLNCKSNPDSKNTLIIHESNALSYKFFSKYSYYQSAIFSSPL